MPLENSLEVLDTFLSILTFAVGCMVGSFLNVCIYRLPRDESIIHPRSHCPKCGQPIAWYDNLPLVSWLILGAKCRNCGAVISWQYPLVEAITGTLFLCVYWRFGMTPAAPVYTALVAGLIVVTFVDLATWTIPNEVTMPGIPIGIACALVGMFYPASGLIVRDVFASLIGAAAGGGLLYLLDKLTLLLLKKRGMGFGDVKLLAMLGAFFGWQSLFLIILASSLMGSVVGLSMLAIKKDKQTENGDEGAHYLPFGPYLAIAGVLYLLFGPALIEWYLGSMHVPEPTHVLPVM